MVNRQTKTFAWLLTLLVLPLLAGCKRTYVNSEVIVVPGAVLVSRNGIDSAEPAIAASSSGEVYVTWVNHGSNGQADVMLARFTSDGQPQGGPVRVNPQAGNATAWHGDPPTVVVAPDQSVYVGWTGKVDSETGHATNLYLSASHDHGQTFAAPVKVNDDQKPSSHGLHSLAVGSDGRIYLAWLDDRNLAPPPKHEMQSGANKHEVESNRELFSCFSTDGGRTFSTNQRIATEVCPCCKTSLAVASNGRVYASWRQVLPNDFRHIAVASSSDGGQTFGKSVIVSDDHWMLTGCPVSGPALTTGTDGGLRVLWYAGAENDQQGIYWSETHDGGQSFLPRRLLAAGFARSSPVLLSDSENVPAAVWETSANGRSDLYTMALTVAGSASDQLKIAEDSELPAAVGLPNRLLVAYVVKDGEKRAVWLRTVSRFRDVKRNRTD